jgi:hypothetical protein
MNHIFTCHLRQSSQNTFQNALPLIDCVFWEVVEPSADGASLNILESQVNWVLGLINPLKLHEVGMIEHLSDLDFVY